MKLYQCIMNIFRALSHHNEIANTRQKSTMAMPNIFFIHIPKTGGQSFSALLDDLFHVEQIYPHQTLAERHLKTDSNRMESYKLVHGHFPLCVLKDLVDKSLESHFCCTFLRSPLARVLSAYKHVLRDVAFTNWIFENNTSTFYLSGLPLNKGPYSLNAHLESAKETLEQLDFVGILEDYEASIKMFCDILGIPRWMVSARKSNVSFNTLGQIENKLKDEILSANWADVELYRYAKKIFQQKLAHNQVVQQRIPLPPSNGFSFYMDESLLGSGWWTREGMGTSHPQTWRWVVSRIFRTFCSRQSV